MTNQHSFTFLENYLQIMEEDKTTRNYGGEESSVLFSGFGGRSWNVAEEKILQRFAQLGLEKIVKGEVQFVKQPPVYEEIVNTGMLRYSSEIDQHFKQRCVRAIARKGIPNFNPDYIPLQGNWPDFTATPYNLDVEELEALMTELFDLESSRSDRLLTVRLQKHEFETTFHALQRDYLQDQKDWENQITKCIETWREVLGERVLETISLPLSARDMPGTLTKLRTTYGSSKEDSYAIYDRIHHFAYLPSETTFLGFLKEFEEIFDLQPIEKKPSDETKLSYLVSAFQRGGFQQLDRDIDMFLLQEGDRLTYEKMKNWLIRRIAHLQNEARKQFEKKKTNNNSKELEVKWEEEEEENNNEDDDDDDDASEVQEQEREETSSGDSSSCSDINNNNNSNSSSSNSFYRNKYGTAIARKERPRQVVYSRGGSGANNNNNSSRCCSYCDRLGHDMDDCWMLQRDQDYQDRRRKRFRGDW
jgi:hypothetical protein